MTFTYVPGDDIFRVRRTIPDRVQADAIFTDEEITSFIDDEGDWRRATALAIETIAVNETLTLKVLRLSSISTDGAKEAAVLLNRASSLREQANLADAESGAAFDVAEWVTGPFGMRERLYDEALRQGG